jgi:hypothetical protein
VCPTRLSTPRTHAGVVRRAPRPGPSGRQLWASAYVRLPRTTHEKQTLWVDRRVCVTTSTDVVGTHTHLSSRSSTNDDMPRKVVCRGRPTLQKPSCNLLSYPSQSGRAETSMTCCRLSRMEKELNQIGGESKLDNGSQPSTRLLQVDTRQKPA